MAVQPRNEDRSSPGVTIGLREIYDKVADVAGQITHLAAVFAALQTTQQTTATDTSELEVRVRFLEMRAVVTPRAMWTAIGVLAGVVSAVVAVISVLLLMQ